MNALDTRMIAYRAEGSTVLVKTENRTVNGFFVREGLVATSARILEDGADRLYLQRDTEDPVLFHVDGAAFQDSESGIAFLRVSSLTQRVLPLSVDSLQVGERVYVVENIEKYSRTVWREATVNSFQIDPDMPRILFDGSVPGGAVGSAVLNEQSEAVGVIVDVPTGGGTFAAMPSVQLKEAVSQIKHDGSRRIDFNQATRRFGKGPVKCLAFSPDGKTLAVGSSLSVRLYDAETGAQRNRFNAWQVQAVAFSPDGKTLAAALEMGYVELWDVETGRSPEIWGHNYDAKALAFSPDGQTLATGSCDDIMLWNLQTVERIARFQHDEKRVSYWAHAFSPDGQTVASSREDHTVRLWNPETQEPEITLKGHTNLVHAVSYSADGRTLITGGDDKTIRIWNAETGDCVQTLENASEFVRSISCSRGGNLFVSGGWGGDLLIRDIETGQIQRRIEAHTEDIHCAAISPDGKTAASAARDAEIRLWNVETGEAQTVVKGHVRGGEAAAFSPDGETLAVAADNKIWLWSAETGDERIVLRGCAGRTYSTAFSPDGETLASCGENGAVRLWNAQTGKLEAEMKGHTDKALLTAFSPDGKTAVSAGEDKTVRVWDVQTKTGRTAFTAENSVNFKALSADGKTVAGVCKENGLQVWNVETGELQATLAANAEGIYRAAFSTDGRTLASAEERDKSIAVRLWDLQTGECKAALTGHRNSVHRIVFSPNDAILATSSYGVVTLWDIQKEWHIMTIDTGLGYTAYPVFSADGTKLATAGSTGSTLLWDIADLLPADAPRPA